MSVPVFVVAMLGGTAIWLTIILIKNRKLTGSASMQSSELRQAIIELKAAVREANASADRIEHIATKKEEK